MQHVGWPRGQQRRQIGRRAARPQRVGRRTGRAHAGQLVVVSAVFAHLVAGGTQQRHLGLHHGVFAPALLVGVVGDKDLHRAVPASALVTDPKRVAQQLRRASSGHPVRHACRQRGQGDSGLCHLAHPAARA